MHILLAPWVQLLSRFACICAYMYDQRKYFLYLHVAHKPCSESGIVTIYVQKCMWVCLTVNTKQILHLKKKEEKKEFNLNRGVLVNSVVPSLLYMYFHSIHVLH